MGHSEIKPEHLLVGLAHGDGLAAQAMAEAGVIESRLRQRVLELYASKATATKIDKLPFSAEAKKCLEQSLRASLALGHNYIGTEHLFFGIQREAETTKRPLDDLLGVSAEDIHRRLSERIRGLHSEWSSTDATTSGHARLASRPWTPFVYSPAAEAALAHARSQAGPSPITTGHLLAGMLADLNTQVARALSEMSIDPQQLQAALGRVDLAETSDATPKPQSVTITIGDDTTVIADPDLAAALQPLSRDELLQIIKRSIEPPAPDQAAG